MPKIWPKSGLKSLPKRENKYYNKRQEVSKITDLRKENSGF